MSGHDEDLDDLDDVVDEFTSSSAPPTSTSTALPTAPLTPSTSASGPSSAPPPATDFPDPDDDDLSLDPLALGHDLTTELEKGMAQLMGELGSPGDGEDDAELHKLLAGLMKGDLGGGFGGAPGLGAGADGGGEEGEMAALLAALSGTGGGAGAFAPPLDFPPAGVPGSSGAGAKSAKPGAPSAPANFQDAIKASMSKMKESSTNAQATAEAENAAGSDPLAALLAQMGGGLPGAGMGEEGLQGMLDEMMEQLMSRELLYQPLKELLDKYPEYLSDNAAILPAADLARFQKQQGIVAQIVAKFEEPGADKEEGLSPAEEAERKTRGLEVVDLVAKMNECGAPPKEIMGELPPGMDLGADGVPKLPDDCSIM